MSCLSIVTLNLGYFTNGISIQNQKRGSQFSSNCLIYVHNLSPLRQYVSAPG